ncbi:4818_t:CDS:2, partial [Racocetra fulgida]
MSFCLVEAENLCEYDTEYSPTNNDHDDDYSTTPDLLNDNFDSSTDQPNNERATVEVPPPYPAFRIAYAIKANKQLNILQPTSSISDSVPTLHEFFEQLNKAYNDSNDDYLKLEAAFAREKLTVN